jgi:hypothetical protein
MKNLNWIIIMSFLFMACGKKPMMSTKSGSDKEVSQDASKVTKVDKVERAQKTHSSIKSYDKVPDIVTDQHHKPGHSSSAKYTKGQAKKLKKSRSNHNNNINNHKKDEDYYMLY